jgi:hypothetical protein
MQMRLYRQYLAANIGTQYMRLDWADFRNEDVRSTVTAWIDNWPSYKKLGMGLEFGGEGLGVGKTFSATHVGKELIKKGEKVYFIPFLDFIRLTGKMMDHESTSLISTHDDVINHLAIPESVFKMQAEQIRRGCWIRDPRASTGCPQGLPLADAARPRLRRARHGLRARRRVP